MVQNFENVFSDVPQDGVIWPLLKAYIINIVLEVVPNKVLLMCLDKVYQRLKQIKYEF